MIDPIFRNILVDIKDDVKTIAQRIECVDSELITNAIKSQMF